MSTKASWRRWVSPGHETWSIWSRTPRLKPALTVKQLCRVIRMSQKSGLSVPWRLASSSASPRLLSAVSSSELRIVAQSRHSSSRSQIQERQKNTQRENRTFSFPASFLGARQTFPEFPQQISPLHVIGYNCMGKGRELA